MRPAASSCGRARRQFRPRRKNRAIVEAPVPRGPKDGRKIPSPARRLMYHDPTQCDRCGRVLPAGPSFDAAAPPVTPSAPTLSIIVPLLNEAEVLEETYRRLK